MQTFTLDLTNKEIVPLLNVKQKDVGTKIAITITDNGKAYTIPTGAMFSVWFSGKSGSGNYTKIGGNSAFSVDGSTVTVELILQMLNKPGEHLMCLVMKSANGNQIGLWNIPYCVEALPGANSEPATTYFENLEAAQEAADRAEAAAKRAEAAAGGGGDVDLTVLYEHLANQNNPHNVTAEQIKAVKILVADENNRVINYPTEIRKFVEDGFAVYLNMGEYIPLSYVTSNGAYFTIVRADGNVETYEVMSDRSINVYLHSSSLTEEDKAEIVADVIAALPVYNGEVV